MLVSLVNVPTTLNDWNSWSTSHRSSHDRINQAIQQKYNQNLPDLIIDPINENATKDFLINNQDLHNNMNAALQLQGSDLQEVDFKDKGQLAAWIYTHYQEHFDAEAALGV